LAKEKRRRDECLSLGVKKKGSWLSCTALEFRDLLTLLSGVRELGLSGGGREEGLLGRRGVCERCALVSDQFWRIGEKECTNAYCFDF
jgi:hypothetical protein